MPPKKNEEMISEIIEEALRPIKDAMKDIVTNEAMANHIQPKKPSQRNEES